MLVAISMCLRKSQHQDAKPVIDYTFSFTNSILYGICLLRMSVKQFDEIVWVQVPTVGCVISNDNLYFPLCHQLLYVWMKPMSFVCLWATDNYVETHWGVAILTKLWNVVVYFVPVKVKLISQFQGSRPRLSRIYLQLGQMMLSRKL